MFDQLDVLARTRDERLSLLGLYASFWVFWQVVWNGLVFSQVLWIRDYDQLYVLYGKLSGWTSCFLIRLLLYVVQSVPMGWGVMLRDASSCFRPGDLLFVFCGLLYLSGVKKKDVIWSEILYLCTLLGVVGITAGLCLRAGSIMEVVSWLKSCSIVSLVVNLALLLNTFVLFLRQILVLIEECTKKDVKSQVK